MDLTFWPMDVCGSLTINATTTSFLLQCVNGIASFKQVQVALAEGVCVCVCVCVACTFRVSPRP